MVGLSPDPTVRATAAGPHGGLRLRHHAGQPDGRRGARQPGVADARRAAGGPLEIVDVFRRPRPCPPSSTRRSRSARRRSGCSSAARREAAARARAAGLEFVAGPLHQDGALPLVRRAQLGRPRHRRRRRPAARSAGALPEDRGPRLRVRHPADPRRPARRPDHRRAGACRSTRRRPTSSRTPTTPPSSSTCNRFGNIYTRIINPTTAAFEERMARARGRRRRARDLVGHGCPDDRDADAARAGRRDRLLAAPLRRHVQPVRRSRCRASASTTRFVDPHDLRRVRAARSTPRTRLLYAETIGNPRIDVLDIAAGGADRRRTPACR